MSMLKPLEQEMAGDYVRALEYYILGENKEKALEILDKVYCEYVSIRSFVDERLQDYTKFIYTPVHNPKEAPTIEETKKAIEELKDLVIEFGR